MLEKISLDLSSDEVGALLNILGQLPNSSGTYPLMMKIREQVSAQLTAKPEATTALS